MDAKTTSIVAYLSWIGFLIALLAGDKRQISHESGSCDFTLFHDCGNSMYRLDLGRIHGRVLDIGLCCRNQSGGKGSSFDWANQAFEIETKRI